MSNLIKRNLTKEEEKKLVAMLKYLGLPNHLLGYQYIKEGIILIKKDEKILRSVTQRLYPEIAKRCDTTASKVERAIRHSIDIAYLRMSQDAIIEIFGYSVSPEKGKPTNLQFLATVSEYFNLQYIED